MGKTSRGRIIPGYSVLIIIGMGVAGRLLPAQDAARPLLSGASGTALEAPVILFPKSPALKHDLVALANPEIAHKLNLSLKQYRRIAAIDAELDKNARQTMQAAIVQWERRGGFHREAIPNFRDPRSPYGQQLRLLKQAAEEQIAQVLSSAEWNQWQEEASPMPGKSAEKFVPATL